MSQPERQQTNIDHHHGLLSLTTSLSIFSRSITSTLEHLFNLSEFKQLGVQLNPIGLSWPYGIYPFALSLSHLCRSSVAC